jgi:hypothetical protein
MFATLRKARAEEVCLLCRAQVTSWNITIGRASHSWIIRGNLRQKNRCGRFAIRHFLLSGFVIRYVFIVSQKNADFTINFYFKTDFQL